MTKRYFENSNRFARRYGREHFANLILALSIAICLSGAARAVQARVLPQTFQLTPIQIEIERQRQRLESTEVEERRDALVRLGSFRRADASRVATRGLSDPIPVVRATAAHAVVHLQGEEAAALLLPLLQDRVEFVRQETAYALGETRSRSAVQPLVGVLHGDKMNSVRAAAAVALGWIGDEAAVVPLSQILAGEPSAIPRTGLKKILRRSRENDPFLRRAAAHSLGQIRSRAAVPALAVALSNEANPADLRREAAIALGLIGDKSATPALHAALASSDAYLAHIAHDSLRQLR